MAQAASRGVQEIVLAALVLCAGLARAQAPELRVPAAVSAARGAQVPLPSLPALALPADVAALPVSAVAPPPARTLLGTVGGALKNAAVRRAPGAVLDSFWSGRGQVAAEAAASETVADRLNQIVAIAKSAPTGQAILRHLGRLTRRSKAPSRIAFADLGRDLGRFDYVSDTLTLDRRFLTADKKAAAVTLTHELLHVVQHAMGLPAEALELELHAHALSLKMMDELGVPARKRDAFSRELLKRLRKSPRDYVHYLAEQLPGKFYLEGRNFSELADAQEDELERQDDKAGKVRNPAKAERARQLADWIRRDIKILRSSAGRKRYLYFSKRVAVLIARLSRTL